MSDERTSNEQRLDRIRREHACGTIAALEIARLQDEIERHKQAYVDLCAWDGKEAPAHEPATAQSWRDAVAITTGDETVIATHRAAQPPPASDALLTLRALIGSESIAISFQSMGQYRRMLLQAITDLQAGGPPSTKEASQPPVPALAKFGAAVLEEARGELGDLDGGWLQDKALECGCLESVTAIAPCGDDCRCAEYGDFPQECFQYTEEVRAALTKGAHRLDRLGDCKDCSYPAVGNWDANQCPGKGEAAATKEGVPCPWCDGQLDDHDHYIRHGKCPSLGE